MTGQKILIIEDDRFLSLILKGRLEKEGFSVYQAFDGEEGLLMLRDIQPDLVLLDLILPKLSGFEVLEAVASDPQLSHIPIVVASNLGQESDMEKAKNLGAIDYYVKVKTSIDELTEIVKKIIPAIVSAVEEMPPRKEA